MARYRNWYAVVCVCLFLGLQAKAQPVINTIGSGLNGPNPTATLPPAITVDTNLPNGFTLILDGQFSPANFIDVTWFNTVTSQTIVLSANSVTATEVQVPIPPSAFQGFQVNSPQTVTVTAVQSNGTASANFTINPALGFPINNLASQFQTEGIILQPGVVGAAYSQPFAFGGTGPFNSTLVSGSAPPGLPLPVASNLLAGIPTTTGVYSWTVKVTDAWGNSISLAEGVLIVGNLTISSLVPQVIPAGSPGLNLIVNGTGFIQDSTVQGGTIPGSVVIIPNADMGPLSTTFVSANQLTALVPSFLFNNPGVIPIQVIEADSIFTSNIATLTVAPPSITSLSPGGGTITARPTPITVTVSGANFVVNNQFSPSTSIVLLNGSPVATTFVNGSTLTFSQVFTPGVYTVQVTNPGGSASNTVNLTVLAAPTITSLSPSFASSGSAAFTLTVTGTNFTNTMQVALGGVPVATRFVNATTLAATLPANLNTGSTSVTVVTADNYVTPPFPFTVYPRLQITTTSLPGGINGSGYNATLTATGGLAPYNWSATGLQGLTLNSRTGALSGTLNSGGNFSINVTVTDSNGTTASAAFLISVVVPTPPVTITTSNSLPVGMVGVAYSGFITAGGGVGNFTFGVDVGSLPPGLTISSAGVITGTPTAPGTFNFTIRATDSAGNLGTSGFSILIKPAPLTVNGPASPITLTLNSAVSLQFSASGGVPPYSYNVTGNLPPGSTFSRTALLSGTATTAGTYGFTVLVTDSTGLQASKSFTVTVTPPQLSITASLGSGVVGSAYSGSVSATGGQPPYTLSVSGLPDGLSFSGGAVTGTPATAGTFTVTASATDSAGTQATSTFTVTIQPPALSITTASLASGNVGAAYSASINASGGVPPYTFSISGLPAGLTSTSAGSISGTPASAGTSSVGVTVTDSKGTTATKTYQLTIAVPALIITTASVSNTTVGAAVSATFGASGGVPPYTWSATGLPAGFTLSTGGVLSGTATTTGPVSFTATVKDSAGTTASRSVTFTVALPPAPTLNLNGLPASSNPATQSTLQIGLGAAYPVDVTVTITLTFAPDSGADDPTVQLSTGGRVATVTIPAGSTLALTNIGVQTGTVAGIVTITAKLTAASQDITPAPAPTRTIRINGAAASATSVTATATASTNSFTVTVIGFDTTRSITSAIFTFTPAPGANLQTTTLTLPVGSIFATWWGSSASAAFGSQFTFTQTFNVQGGVTSIASVSVTLVNSVGNSIPATATVH